MSYVHLAKRSWLAVVAVFASMLPLAVHAGEVAKPKPDQAVKFVFLGDTKPVLLHVFVELDGRSTQEKNVAFYKRWFEYLDRDGNGSLSQAEAKHAPTDQTIKRLMQNGFFFPYNGVSLVGATKKHGKREISWQAFYGFYRGLVPPVQISVASASPRYSRVRAPVADAAAVGKTILAKLDANRDGTLSQSELAKAESSLRYFDLNDDELVTANEIAGVMSNSGGGLVRFVRNNSSASPAHGRLADGAFYYLLSDNVDSALGLLLLSQYDDDFDRRVSREEAGLPKKAFAKLDVNRDEKLDAKELSSWHRRSPDATMTVRLGATTKSKFDMQFIDKQNALPVANPSKGVMLVTIGDARIQVAGESAGSSQMMRVSQSRTRYYLLQFKQAAKNRKYVKKSDLNTPQARLLSQLFDVADQNQDGKMTERELKDFTSMVGRGPKGVVTLSIVPQGRQLFRLLDRNRNGNLSIRELRLAWKHLKNKDKNNDGAISQNEILREYQLTFYRGRNMYGAVRVVSAANPLGSFPRLGTGRDISQAPIWFQKMDRNGDGDVSATEFLGSRATFDQIDVDRDGLIAPDEARSADKNLRK